jgi:hippurate hydrolase
MVVAVGIVQALQTIVARNVDPLESVVVSVTKIHVGDVYNVIAETGRVAGTVRTLKPAMRDLVETRIRAVAEGVATLHGATVAIDYDRNYPVTQNHAAETEFAAAVARDVVGADRVSISAPPMMGGEDFSYMLEARPGAFLFIGNGDTAGLHSPAYDFNDDVLPVGCSFWARLVETAMPA